MARSSEIGVRGGRFWGAGPGRAEPTYATRPREFKTEHSSLPEKPIFYHTFLYCLLIHRKMYEQYVIGLGSL